MSKEKTIRQFLAYLKKERSVTFHDTLDSDSMIVYDEDHEELIRDFLLQEKVL